MGFQHHHYTPQAVVQPSPTQLLLRTQSPVNHLTRVSYNRLSMVMQIAMEVDAVTCLVSILHLMHKSRWQMVRGPCGRSIVVIKSLYSFDYSLSNFVTRCGYISTWSWLDGEWIFSSNRICYARCKPFL